MLQLHTTLDLMGNLSAFIFSYRSKSRSEYENSLTEDYPNIIPRLVNQEKDGTVIFVWNDVDYIKQSSVVTYFGLYEPELQTHSVIYTYEKKVKVVSCSINQERTLLAFSISRPKETTDKKSKDIYQAYLAELQSLEKIVFSLNMDRSTFLKVQFLYLYPESDHSRASHMLVFLHKESIGLYKVPMARIGDQGVMMSGQPKTEQVVRKFVWCQWDVQHQRLYYIHNMRVDKTVDRVRHSLSTIQFRSDAKYENMMDVPINFQFPYIRTADKPLYGDIPLSPGIPDLSLNVSVLTQSTGTFCLCYQKLLADNKNKSASQSTDLQDLEYYISMVHHGKTLYGCVSNLPRDVISQKRLMFSWLGSYLVVMLPGYFVHLLNVGPGFEPCHHILLHDAKLQSPISVNPFEENLSRQSSVKVSFDYGESNTERSDVRVMSSASLSSPVYGSSHAVIPVFSDQCSRMKTLLPCQSFTRESGSAVQTLYDYRSGYLMKMVICSDSIVESFKTAYWQTRLAILHYLILHSRDFVAVKALFEVLSENVTNLELHGMFTEYLAASTFAEMRKQVDKEILSLLSFTSIQTLRGQFEKSLNGERLAHISYLTLDSVDLNKRSSDRKKGKDEDFWDILVRRVRSRHTETPPKFTHQMLMTVYRQAEMEEVAGKSLWNPMHVDDSFFEGIYSLKLTELPASLRRKSAPEVNPTDKASGRRSRTEAVLGQMPLFLQAKISQESSVFKRRLSILTEELLVKHLTKYLRKESRSKAKNVAREYLFCLARVSRQMCHLIWSLKGESMSHDLQDTLLPSLQEPATHEEHQLMQLYEVLYLTAGELGYPLPPGFSSFFTALGFKCLELHLFLQYVDNHIFVLTPDFILQLLADLPDENEDAVKVKFQIISRLPKPFADECFERWNHPTVQLKKAREQAGSILLHGLSMPDPTVKPAPKEQRRFIERHDSTASEGANQFSPLSTLMQHMDQLANNVQSPRPVLYDKRLIEGMALYHTKKDKTRLDMSTVNF